MRRCCSSESKLFSDSLMAWMSWTTSWEAASRVFSNGLAEVQVVFAAGIESKRWMNL